MKRSIPVLYYHRIGSPDGIHLSIPTALFEKQIGFLSKRGFKSIGMQTLYRHISGAEPVNFPAFAVTFDDGFRDNLANAFPVLRKYKCRASIFPVSSLVRSDNAAVRDPPRDFNQAHLAARGGDCGDFLSWKELSEMASTGLVEFHSHTRSHNQVFIGNTVLGVFPDTDAHWGIVSAYGFPLPNGSWPVFPRTAGFLAPAWKPEFKKIDSAGTSWMALFKQKCEGSPHQVPTNWFSVETQVSYVARVRADLKESKESFAGFHPSGCDLLCWPWGVFNPLLIELAREVGYSGALATSTGANLPGNDPFSIHRFPVRKPDMVRFALSVWLRSAPALAEVYRPFRNWGR